MVDIFKKLTQRDDEPRPEDERMISVLVDVYNDYDRVVPLSKEITDIFEQLAGYRCELVFIDSGSDDGSRDLLKMLCSRSKKIKAIFGAGNRGRQNARYYGMLQCEGDCVICISADGTEPAGMIPRFIEEWEKGSAIVCGTDISAQRGSVKNALRRMYYRLLKSSSGVERIEGFTGFGLYDRSFIEVLRELDDPVPYLRGIVAELGYDRTCVPYEPVRAGKGNKESRGGLFALYDTAMLGFTSYARLLVRLAAAAGAAGFAVSLIAAAAHIVSCIIHHTGIISGTVPILIAVCLSGSLQLFFTGIIGEYVMSINRRVMRRPVFTEEKRLNFDADGGRKKREDKK